MYLKPILRQDCPDCGLPLKTKETRFEARKRRCDEGHVHFTLGLRFIDRPSYNKFDVARQHKRPSPTDADVRFLEPGDPPEPPPRPEPEPESEPEDTSMGPRQYIKTGHFVSTNEYGGRVYRMRW